jgi:hypothetical protein
MVKAILLMMLGAVSYHLYANTHDRERVIYKTRYVITEAADTVANTARPSIIDQLTNQ